MAKKISKRCGKGTCEFYNKHNPISGCLKFEDRNDCDQSLSHRKKVSKKSIVNQNKHYRL